MDSSSDQPVVQMAAIAEPVIVIADPVVAIAEPALIPIAEPELVVVMDETSTQPVVAEPELVVQMDAVVEPVIPFAEPEPVVVMDESSAQPLVVAEPEPELEAIAEPVIPIAEPEPEVVMDDSISEPAAAIADPEPAPAIVNAEPEPVVVMDASSAQPLIVAGHEPALEQPETVIPIDVPEPVVVMDDSSSEPAVAIAEHEPVVVMDESSTQPPLVPEPELVVQMEVIAAPVTPIAERESAVVMDESSSEPVADIEDFVTAEPELEPVVVTESRDETVDAMEYSDEPPTKKRKTSSSRFIWEVENFSKLRTERLYSDVFALDGYEWRILIFPRGVAGKAYLSIFLYVVDAGILPYGWTRDTKFSFSVISQENDEYTVKKDFARVFNLQDDDYGQIKFMPLSKLHDPSKGYLIDDILKIKVDIQVSIDMKQETVYVGPQNQVVNFRRLDNPTEDVFCFELSMHSSYDEVLETVASKLGIEDSFLQLSRHDSLSDKPEETSIGGTLPEHLYDLLLQKDQKICDIVYYDVLSTPRVGSKDSEDEHSRTSACVVCWNAPRQGVCIPCGHMSSCMQCMKVVQDKNCKCPICRTRIQKVVKVYFS